MELDDLIDHIIRSNKKADKESIKKVLSYVDMAYCIGVDNGQVRKSKPVIRSDGKPYKSISSAARRNLVNEKSIRRAIKNGNKSAGYKWSLA